MHFALLHSSTPKPYSINAAPDLIPHKKLKSFCKFFISCLNLKMVVPKLVLVLLLQFFCCAIAVSDHSHLPASTLFIPSDASSLLAFKLKADFAGKLCFSSNSSVLAFCQWNGVRCSRDRVVRVVFDGMGLSGGFAPGTLTRLDRLRVLSLRRNELTGPIPDLSGLGRLKFLFLDHNLFSGLIPPSISGLGRIRIIDLSHNRLAGPVPVEINRLDQLRNFRVECNRLNGSVPPLNQTNLEIFNISLNRLSGPVPVTPTLSRFNASSFFSNRGLCGKIIGKECHSVQPFFPLSKSPSSPEGPAAALGQNAQSRGGVGIYNLRKKTSKKYVLIIAVSAMGSLALVCSILCFALAARKMGGNQISSAAAPKTAQESIPAAASEEDDDDEEKAKKVREGMRAMGKSGNLVFCACESPAYTLEQLMTASAELLGRGTMATTYKAVLDDRTVVCVKRLDAGKVAGGANKDEFERHMESVGALRHPNLVALRAYFRAKEERILVYDYFRNGNLDSLIHGGTTKPLHWTSCLKIAEDIAQALSYIHQAWRLVHGNLKSSNVLLGSDFEACLSDYSLSLLANPFSDEDPDPDSSAYKAPEIRRSNRHRRPTAKSDVYSFGVLLLEVISGKRPSEQPFLPPEGMAEWVRSVRREDDGGDGNGDRTEMILEVGMACRVSSPEQRPDMWQVLKMIQEIKDGVIMEDSHEMDLIKGN